MTTKIKFTAEQIKEHVKSIRKLIEKQKQENKEEYFIALTPEEIEAKLRRVNSPMIWFESWGNTTPGGTINYNLGSTTLIRKGQLSEENMPAYKQFKALAG